VTEAVHGERAHAWASPSKLASMFVCPARPAFEEAAGPEVRDPNGPAAAGERKHERAEILLRTWKDTDRATDDADTIAVVQPYLDAVRERFGGKNGATLGRLLLIEERVDIHLPDCFGTPDAAIVDPFDRRIVVVDLKGGGHVVDATENVQLGAYACGLLAKHAGKPKEWAGWTVELVIVQGLAMDGGPPVRAWSTTGAWCVKLHKRIVATVKASRVARPVPKVGDCSYCRAAATCPARLAQAGEVFPIAVVDNPTGDEPGEPTGRAPDVALLDDATVGRVLDLADDIESFIAACRARAAERGVPGWKLVAGKKGARRWTDPKTATAALLGAGIDPFGLAPLKSPTTVEKETGKDVFACTFAPLVESPPGKPALVRESDPRPAIAAGSMFPAVSPGDAGAAS
jgi:hypothetical protein